MAANLVGFGGRGETSMKAAGKRSAAALVNFNRVGSKEQQSYPLESSVAPK
ncbi:hypothetical protein [Allosphingosinicella sp.]|uniref:hypothetical protein n=1 Tax=Allosphingosinicella sp. TaxID=2823234 RepID=UPI003D705073